ncbi:phage tail domain-containing protein [Enterococcus rotai]|uniref:phage tail domain-containing protein n=1 Tax=Enterococcus rotai TaxID=118060 RepID=UPI0032B5F863
MIGYFEYDNKNSLDFGLTLDPELEFESPEQDVEFVPVKGVDGEIAIDNESLKNVNMPFPCTLLRTENETIEEKITNVTNWLKGKKGWHQFIFSGDPKHVYTAMCHSNFSFKRKSHMKAEADIPFTLKPIKYLSSGLVDRVVTNGQILYNEGTRIGKPVIRITGNGDITLRVGTSVCNLKGIDEGIILDCKSLIITSLDGLRPQGDKVNKLPLPSIPPGQSVISWSGNVSEVKLTPRWETII